MDSEDTIDLTPEEFRQQMQRSRLTHLPNRLDILRAEPWASIRLASLIGGAVAQVLLIAALPILVAAVGHSGPAFLRGPEGVLAMLVSGGVLALAAGIGATQCVQEARR